MIPNRLPWPLSAIPRNGEFGADAPPRVRPHRGTDWSKYHILRLGLSLRVPAVAAGEVVRVQRRDVGELGLQVEVRDEEGYYWTYCHLASIDQSVKVGTRLELGETFAVVGSSGTAALAGLEHLHLALARRLGAGVNGAVLDPIAHILARSLSTAGTGTSSPLNRPGRLAMPTRPTLVKSADGKTKKWYVPHPIIGEVEIDEQTAKAYLADGDWEHSNTEFPGTLRKAWNAQASRARSLIVTDLLAALPASSGAKVDLAPVLAAIAKIPSAVDAHLDDEQAEILAALGKLPEATRKRISDALVG